MLDLNFAASYFKRIQKPMSVKSQSEDGYFTVSQDTGRRKFKLSIEF